MPDKRMSGAAFCDTCKVNCRTLEKYESHIRTELHLKISAGTTDGPIFNNDRPVKLPLLPAPLAPPTTTHQVTPQYSSSNSCGNGAGAGAGGVWGWRAAHRDEPHEGSPELYQHAVPAEHSLMPEAEDQPNKSTPVLIKGSSNKFCAVCHVQTSGPESFEQHLKGAKHKKNIVKSGIRLPPERKIRPVKFQKGNVHLQSSIDGYCEPLLGLQYLVEFQSPNTKQPTSYECFLCDAQMDLRNTMAHIMGFKHKFMYLRTHYPHSKTQFECNTVNGATAKQLLLEQATTVAADEGRYPIAVYEWDGVTEWTKPDVHTGAQPFKRVHTSSTSQRGPAAKKQAFATSSGHPEAISPQERVGTTGSSGEASLFKLLGALESYVIRSELEAGLVIKIRQSLSNSLDTYNAGHQAQSATPAAETTVINYAKAATTTATTHHTESHPQHRTPEPTNWAENSNTGVSGSYGYGQRSDLFDQNSWY